MKTTLLAVVCAAMAMALAACSSEKQDERMENKRTQTDVTVRNDTSVPSDADVQRIRKVLAETVDAAMTRGGLDDVVERLSDGDRDRIGKYANNSYPDLDGRINEIQKAWHDRYNKDFAIKDDPAAFTDWRITGDQYHASVIVPMMGKMPAFTLKMVNEGKIKNAWRIDIPDDINGQQLKDRMLDHLTMFGRHQGMWPADMHDAYRVASYHVLAALTGVNLPPAVTH